MTATRKSRKGVLHLLPPVRNPPPLLHRLVFEPGTLFCINDISDIYCFILFTEHACGDVHGNEYRSLLPVSVEQVSIIDLLSDLIYSFLASEFFICMVYSIRRLHTQNTYIRTRSTYVDTEHTTPLEREAAAGPASSLVQKLMRLVVDE